MNTSSHGFGEFVELQDQPPETHEAITLGTDIPGRWRLASRDDLSRSVIELLANDPSHDVRTSLALNVAVPMDILAAMAQRHPELTSAISTNANAPAALKKCAPILGHTSFSIARFVDEEEATAAERRALTKVVSTLDRQLLRLDPAGRNSETLAGPFLGDVWATIRPT